MSLDLDKYSLRQVVFEARFTANWMHWDKAGALWTDAFRKFPELRIAAGQPQQTTFLLGRAIQLQVLNDRLSIAGVTPVDMEALTSAADEITRLVVKHFNVGAMSRLGIRFHLFQEKKDAASSTDELLRALGIPQPSGKHFGIDGKVIRSTVSMRWEGPRQGVNIRIAAEGRKISFHPGIDIAPFVEPVVRDIEGVLIDADVYTVGEIPVGSFRPSDLITDWIRVVKRDLPGFVAQIRTEGVR